MSEGFQRPGNVELQKAMRQLVLYVERRGTGVVKIDRARWAVNYGVNADTSRKYWQQLVEAGAITEADCDGRYKKMAYFKELLAAANSPEAGTQAGRTGENEEKPKRETKLSQRAKWFFETMRIKEKMMSGPCNNICTETDPDDYCYNCDTFLSLKNKDFLKEEA
jgi:hypothetical protein